MKKNFMIVLIMDLMEIDFLEKYLNTLTEK